MCSFGLYFLLWGINSCILQNIATEEGLIRKGHSSFPGVWVKSPTFPSRRGKHLQPDWQNSCFHLALETTLCLTRDGSSLGKKWSSTVIWDTGLQLPGA